MNNLIKKAKKGNEKAFLMLIEDNEVSLYKAAKAILNNDDNIVYAIQETAIAAYKNIKSLKNDYYFKTWLTKTLINVIDKSKEILGLDEYL